jgi:GNAT superfamily N-acetyltransferase
MPAVPLFRLATKDDAILIANLHASSWKIAYRGLLSDEYLDNDLAGERIAYWSGKVCSLTAGEFILMAVDTTGDIEGFIAVMDLPEKGYSALVDNLHVRPDLKGRGIGKALMQRAAQILVDSGRTNYYLWVLNGNEPACRFYESIGGVPADEKTVHFGGKDVLATRFVWDTFDPILEPGSSHQ